MIVGSSWSHLTFLDIQATTELKVQFKTRMWHDKNTLVSPEAY